MKCMCGNQLLREVETVSGDKMLVCKNCGREPMGHNLQQVYDRINHRLNMFIHAVTRAELVDGMGIRDDGYYKQEAEELRNKIVVDHLELAQRGSCYD